MQRNAVVVTIVLLVAIFGFLFLVYSLSNQNSQPQSQTFQEAKQVSTSDHVKWSPVKKVILTEYADLQCPACKSFNVVLKQFETQGSPDSDISKKVTFVFRHFPLSIHKNAVPAGRAAEAAGKQGKFFEMVDLLYQEQESWSDLGNPADYFVGLSKKLKLDVAKFTTDMNSKETQTKIDADLASGLTGRVNSTPTFFLNGEKVEVETFDQFKKLLRDAK